MLKFCFCLGGGRGGGGVECVYDDAMVVRKAGALYVLFLRLAACDHHHSTTPDRPSIILGPLLFKFTLTYAFEELNICQPKKKSFLGFGSRVL